MNSDRNRAESIAGDAFPERVRARTSAFTREVMAETKRADFCFVIMSFAKERFLPDIYKRGIKPVVEAAGYRCETVAEQHFNGKITAKIIENIIDARFIVAELTMARPNCYYEVGIAHALGREVIHLVAKDSSEIHFDLKDYNFIIYEGFDDLEEKLRDRIANTIS